MMLVELVRGGYQGPGRRPMIRMRVLVVPPGGPGAKGRGRCMLRRCLGRQTGDA